MIEGGSELNLLTFPVNNTGLAFLKYNYYLELNSTNFHTNSGVAIGYTG